MLILMPCVLHIDDEADFLKLTKLYLQKEGIKVKLARSCKDGLQKLIENEIDAIICDYHMPEMDGLEFLELIRSQGNKIPFIMLTGRGREEIVIDALNLGANHYLMKGGDMKSLCSELAHTIRQTVTHKRTETKITELMEALERSLDVLEISFEDVEIRNKELEEFIYALSHEFTNSLNNMRGFLELIPQELVNGEIDTVKLYIERIDKTTNNIQSKLTALYNLMQIRHNHDSPEWVSIASIARKIEQSFPELSDPKISFIIDSSLPRVYGNPLQLQLLLENLFTNAVKFKDPNKRLQIEFGCDSSQMEKIFYVKDNGIGVDPSNHDQIFKLFVKLNPEIKGRGIGLQIAKNIIDVHGGRIWVESEGLGHGTTFYFTLSEEAQTSRFKVFEEGMQVNGTTIMAVVNGMGSIARLAKIFFKRVGLPENVISDTKHWYSQQKWLDAFRLVAEKIGEETLFNIGTSIPDNAEFPPEINDIESALESIDIAYHMNHKNKDGEILYDPSRTEEKVMLSGIGHYTYKKVSGEKKAILICENPYPCDFDRGIITAMAQRYEKSVIVIHTDPERCRKKGNNFCTYTVTWT